MLLIKYIATCLGKAYFVVRGTDIKKFKNEWMDLIVSLRMWPKDIRDTKGHNGYIRAGNHMLSLMRDDILKAKEQGYDIVLTGHSLGGVIAKYVACMLDIESRVITFGAPCLAKSDFYRKCNHVEVYKYRMDGDLIPMFPSLFYADVYGDEFMLKRGNVTPDTANRNGFIIPLLFLTKVMFFFNIFNTVKKHGMKFYTLNLLRKYKNQKLKNK